MDRLSELPDSLLLHILSFLPMNDAVITMFLSKQWKTLWRSTTNLTFNDSEMGMGPPGIIDTARFRNFVYRVLVLWKGCRLEEFRITFEISHPHESLHRDICLWVEWAVEKGVERLHLNLLQYPVQEKQLAFWSPPQCLYSCSSLRGLSVFGCNLQINGNVDHVEWHHLKTLCLEVYGLTQHVINQVLAGSPELDNLMLTVFQSNESLSIQSSSLRYLLLEKYMCRAADVPSLDSELRICAPNLETLKLYGFPYSKCLLMNNDVSSLTDVALRFCTVEHDVFNGNYDFLRETALPQILPTIQHVERLKLSDCCIMALGAMEMKNMFANVKLLKLNNYGFQEYEKIATLLASLHQLEMLVLQPVCYKYCSRSCKHGVVEAGTKRLETTDLIPNSSLQKLNRVKVTWTEVVDDSIFPFVEILLKCASNLQKLVFRVRGLPNSSMVAAQTKLLRMPRSSPTAQLFCYEC